MLWREGSSPSDSTKGIPFRRTSLCKQTAQTVYFVSYKEEMVMKLSAKVKNEVLCIGMILVGLLVGIIRFYAVAESNLVVMFSILVAIVNLFAAECLRENAEDETKPSQKMFYHFLAVGMILVSGCYFIPMYPLYYYVLGNVIYLLVGFGTFLVYYLANRKNEEQAEG